MKIFFFNRSRASAFSLMSSTVAKDVLDGPFLA
jgi:hypothetical protein